MKTSIETKAKTHGILLAIILTGFVASTYGFGIYLFANLVVDMRVELDFEYTTVGIITAGAQIGFLSFSFVTSYLSKFIPGWKISLASTLLTSTCLFFLGLSQSLWLSTILLIILGGCSASVYVPLAEIVTRNFNEDKRARVMGLVSSGTSYGVFVNGMLTSLFLADLGWRNLWLITAGISFFLCFVAYFFLRNESHTNSATSVRNNETSSHGPWLSKPLYMLWGFAFLHGVTVLPFQTYLAPYMREELYISPEVTGTVWSTLGAVGMLSGFVVGWLADKKGTRTALQFCLASLAVAGTLVFFMNLPVFFYVAAFFFALAFYPMFGLIPAYIGQVVSVERLTQAFGIANILIGLGGMCGNFLGGLSKDTFGSFEPFYATITIAYCAHFFIYFLLPLHTTTMGPTGREY